MQVNEADTKKGTEVMVNNELTMKVQYDPQSNEYHMLGEEDEIKKKR